MIPDSSGRTKKMDIFQAMEQKEKENVALCCKICDGSVNTD